MYHYEKLSIDGFGLSTNSLNDTIDYLLNTIDPHVMLVWLCDVGDKDTLFNILGDDENLWRYFCYVFNETYISNDDTINAVVSHEKYRVDFNITGSSLLCSNSKYYKDKIVDESIYRLLEDVKDNASTYKCIFDFLCRKFPSEQLYKDLLAYVCCKKFLTERDVDMLTTEMLYGINESLRVIVYNISNYPIEGTKNIIDYIRSCDYLREPPKYNKRKQVMEMRSNIVNLEISTMNIKFNVFYNGLKHRITIIHEGQIDTSSKDITTILNNIKSNYSNNLIVKCIEEKGFVPIELLGNDPKKWDLVYNTLTRDKVIHFKDISILHDRRLIPIKLYESDIEELRLNYPVELIYIIFDEDTGNYAVCEYLLGKFFNTVLDRKDLIERPYVDYKTLIPLETFWKDSLIHACNKKGIYSTNFRELSILITLLTVDYFILSKEIPNELIIYYNSKENYIHKYKNTKLSLKQLAVLYYCEL